MTTSAPEHTKAPEQAMTRAPMPPKVSRPPFNFHSTATQVVTGLSLEGKRVVITGGASGLGVETARALAGIGADVTLAVRDVRTGHGVAAAIAESTGNPLVRALPLDLADTGSISDFVSAWKGPLHVLVNNAAVMALPALWRSPEGLEAHMAVNHFGHFVLARGLRRALAAGSAPEFAARIVSVSSSAHFDSPVIFDDLHFRFRRYEPWMAYAQSKTANILFAVEASRRWADDGIFANAHAPGYVHTHLQRHLPPGFPDPPHRLKTVEQGAANSCLLACCPLVERAGGLFMFDCGIAKVVQKRPEGLDGVAAYAVDPDNARRLWEVSESLLG